MCGYIFSSALSAFHKLAVASMQRGHGAVLLLEGPPGGGKTEFAHAIAADLGGKVYRYQCAPDKERNLLYDISVQGVVTRTHAWVHGPAWRAFEASARGEYAVLLIDEVDKSAQGFDAFLLQLLEEKVFESPEGQEVRADPRFLAVVLTTNGRRQLRDEVLRRCQRVHVPFPEGDRLIQIMDKIAERRLPPKLRDLVVRIGWKVREKKAESAPSPKEMALLCLDLLLLADSGENDIDVWSQVGASRLTKHGGAEAISAATKFDWVKALRNEAFAA